MGDHHVRSNSACHVSPPEKMRLHPLCAGAFSSPFAPCEAFESIEAQHGKTKLDDLHTPACTRSKSDKKAGTSAETRTLLQIKSRLRLARRATLPPSETKPRGSVPRPQQDPLDSQGYLRSLHKAPAQTPCPGTDAALPQVMRPSSVQQALAPTEPRHGPEARHSEGGGRGEGGLGRGFIGGRQVLAGVGALSHAVPWGMPTPPRSPSPFSTSDPVPSPRAACATPSHFSPSSR